MKNTLRFALIAGLPLLCPVPADAGLKAVAGGGANAVTTGTTNVNNAASPYTVLATDRVLYVDTSGGAVTLILPAPTSTSVLSIKDSTGNFGTNNVTLQRNAAESIEGLAASLILSANWGNYEFRSNGTNWFKTSAASNFARFTFASSGNWAAPAGITEITVFGRGGSGGGGGGGAGGGGSTAAGAGGGAAGGSGGSTITLPYRVTVVPGTTYTGTLGAAGSAGNAGLHVVANAAGSTGGSGGNGGDGGTTTFGALASWVGGLHGNQASGGQIGTNGNSGAGGASPFAGVTSSGGANGGTPNNGSAAGVNSATKSPFWGVCTPGAVGAGGGASGGGGGAPTGCPVPGDAVPNNSVNGVAGAASGSNGNTANATAATVAGAGGEGGGGGSGGGAVATTGSIGGDGAAGGSGSIGALVLIWQE